MMKNFKHFEHKKSMIKRVLAVVLVLTLCFGMVQIIASANGEDSGTHVHNQDGWQCLFTISKQTCTTEAHSHNDGCYGPVLICKTEAHKHIATECGGKDTCTKPEHTHQGTCYINGLNCGKTEHTHNTDTCFSGTWTCVAPQTPSEPEKPNDKCDTCIWSGATKTVAPTCTEPGRTIQLCANCGNEITTIVETESTPALGHDWSGEWVITKEPTVDATGEETLTCLRDNCNETQTREIDKLEPEDPKGPMLTATADGPFTGEVGDTFTWTVTLTNNNINNKHSMVVMVSGLKDGYSPSINKPNSALIPVMPGESASFTVTYTATEADADKTLSLPLSFEDKNDHYTASTALVCTVNKSVPEETTPSEPTSEPTQAPTPTPVPETPVFTPTPVIPTTAPTAAPTSAPTAAPTVEPEETDDPIEIPDESDVPMGTPDVDITDEPSATPNPTEEPTDPDETDEPIDIIDPSQPPLGPGPVIPEEPKDTPVPPVTGNNNEPKNPNNPNTPAPNGDDSSTEIDDEEVSLAGAPKTGDDYSLMLLLMLASGCGVLLIGLRSWRQRANQQDRK